MTLVQLRHFVVLARLGSYVQASKELFVTQSALSRSIQSLEDELGQPLFDRLGRRTEPTPFGRDVLQRAQSLVNDADALRQLPPMSDYLSLPPEIVDNPQRSAIHDKKSIFQRV